VNVAARKPLFFIQQNPYFVFEWKSHQNLREHSPKELIITGKEISYLGGNVSTFIQSLTSNGKPPSVK